MTALVESLTRLRGATADAPLVRFDGRWWCRGEISGQADELDARLAGLGGPRRIAVVLANRPASVAAVLATLGRGRMLITLNPLQPIPRLAADAVAAAPDVVLAAPELLADEEFCGPLSNAGIRCLELRDTAASDGANQAGGLPVLEPVKSSDVAVEMFTSGTTGAPKRIALTFRQLEVSLASALEHTRGRGDERPALSGRPGLVALPLVHISGLWGVLQALSSLRAVNSGAAPLDPALAAAFTARFGIPVLSVYGATEFSGAVAGWSIADHRRFADAKRGSVGRAFPGVALRTADAEGAACSVGEVGQLEVRTPQAGADGWVRTNDLARIDADGFVWVVGRADDVIVRGGFKIAPGVVAAALERHPAVREAAVLGLPDERLGQVPVGAVELDPDAPAPTSDELREFCRSDLTPYEIPSAVVIVSALPRGASMKVDRTALTALVEAALQVALR
jgi:acyl-CoA synthetase (AMP-forming)/AMP-acid ligase II